MVRAFFVCAPHESGAWTYTFRPLNRPATGYNTRCALPGAESDLFHPNGRIKIRLRVEPGKSMAG